MDQRAPLGLRERKKLEKARAIREAARELFTTKGYEETTLREIAERADVGFGTVSVYAHDKAGLLAMLFVDDLHHMPQLFAGRIEDRSLLDQLVDGFAPIYGFWGKNPALSRIVLPQMEFYQPNPFAEVILQRRLQVKTALATWIDRARGAGRVGPDVDAAQAARTLFAVFTSALREWILSEPLDIEDGIAQLRFLLALPVQAIATPSDAAPPEPSRSGG